MISKKLESKWNEVQFATDEVHDSFASCTSNEEYDELYNRFIEYIQPMTESQKAFMMLEAIKGIHDFRENMIAALVEDVEYLLNKVNMIVNNNSR